jgi:hypothetical protein
LILQPGSASGAWCVRLVESAVLAARNQVGAACVRMLPVPNESSPTAPNNPAGRVREVLLDFQAIMPTVDDNAMLVLMKMLDEPQESARIYHSMTELRLQAESVPHLMAQYAGMPGYAGYLDHYAQILDVTKRLHMPHQYPATAIFGSIDNGG